MRLVFTRWALGIAAGGLSLTAATLFVRDHLNQNNPKAPAPAAITAPPAPKHTIQPAPRSRLRDYLDSVPPVLLPLTPGTPSPLDPENDDRLLPGSIRSLSGNGPDLLLNLQNQGRTFFTQKTGMENLGSIAPALLAVAGRDILHADPDDFDAVSEREWRSLMQRRQVNIPAGELTLAYLTQQLTVSGLDGTKNFTAAVMGDRTKPDKSICVISGEADSSTRDLVQMMSNLPPTYLTPSVLAQFDRNSLRLFLYLHEASHCNQKIDFRPGDNQTMFVLGKETDADSQALAAYARLAAENPALDQDMPAKVRALRIISAIIPPPGGGMESLFNMFMHTHTTGFVNDVDAKDAPPTSASEKMGIHMGASFGAAITSYNAMTDTQIGGYSQRVETFNAALRRAIQFDRAPADVQDGLRQFEIGMRPAFIGGMYNADQITRMVLSLAQMAETPLPAGLTDALPGEKRALPGKARQGARQFMQAWQTLHLPEPASQPNPAIWVNLVTALNNLPSDSENPSAAQAPASAAQPAP